MKKQILLGLLSLASLNASAQPSIPGNNTEPVKYYDVLNNYFQNEVPLLNDDHSAEPSSVKRMPEGANNQFGRWKWYWSQHLDENGCIVSPVKNWQEWENYFGQNTANKSTANQSNWSFEGPDNSLSGYEGIGRINVMEFHPTNANTYWVGSDGGGIWKTTNDGASWTPLADHLPMLSVSDIDVNPQNVNTMYMCTGDRDGRSYYSVGVLKSYDGGQSWNSTGISYTTSQLRYTNCLLINPQDTNSLTLAASDGIYRSFNGGQTWTNVQAGNFKQVLYKPGDSSIVYATSYFTLSTATSAQIYRSTNGGQTWTQVSSYTTAMRVQLAVTPAAPNIVKALVASFVQPTYRGLQGIYHSNNSGMTFSQIFSPNNCTTNILSSSVFGNGCTGQGNYDLTIAIHPSDPNFVIVGGVNSWYSYDGGYSFDLLNQWTNWASNIAVVHADKHHMAFHPLNGNRFFECNDGGIYRTDNPFSLFWDDVSNGLGITEFYRNAVHNETPYVLGGAQDNGTKYLLDGNYGLISGGDGMECHFDFSDTNIVFTGVQWGKIYRFDYSIGSQDIISDNIPGQPAGAWITPYMQHPRQPYSIIAGYRRIYASHDKGDTWQSISPILTDSDFYRITISLDDSLTIYTSVSDTNIIHYTNNYGNNWTTLTAPYNARISDIKADPKNANRLWVTFSGYGTTKVAKWEQGQGWTLMNDNLPNVPIACIEVDTSNGMLYVGTDIGVFYRDTAMTQWEPFNNQLPSVRVNDLGINYNTHEIWAATYGRGMWRSAKQDQLSVRQLSKATEISVYPNPTKGAFSVVNKGFADKKATVQLLDNSGRVVWKQEARFNASGKMNFEVGNVARGNYVVEVIGGNDEIARQKIVLY